MKSEEMRKRFIVSTKSQLIQFYSSLKEYEKEDTAQKYKIEGFMHAGVVLELTENQELTKLMEQVYFDIFGMTPTERKLIKEKGETKVVDWSFYDTPPTQR